MQEKHFDGQTDNRQTFCRRSKTFHLRSKIISFIIFEIHLCNSMFDFVQEWCCFKTIHLVLPKNKLTLCPVLV